MDDCTARTDGLKCFLRAAVTGPPAVTAACLDITAANCNAVTEITGADRATCAEYSTSCTNDGATACRLSTCETVENPSWANC